MCWGNHRAYYKGCEYYHNFMKNKNLPSSWILRRVTLVRIDVIISWQLASLAGYE
jgi:hypothetical protein